MTGSGASVFAEFAAEGEARALQSQVPDTMRGFVARGIEQHPLHDWAN
jgi:4-diphosphocytidyl-2-C-methyl-D-erythritol kinase